MGPLSCSLLKLWAKPAACHMWAVRWGSLWQGAEGDLLPTANKILNSDDNMNELENEFSPVEPSHKTADAVQMDCNLLRDFVALAFRLTVPGFLIHRDSLVAQMVVCLQCRRSWFNPWVGKIPWRRKWQPTPVFLPGKSHGQRNLLGYSHKELDMTELLHFHFKFPHPQKPWH